jgi:exosortase K
MIFLEKKALVKYGIWLFTLILIVFLKLYYKQAELKQFKWLVEPAVHGVCLLTGSSFSLQSGKGYIINGTAIIVDKSCSGLNFLIIVLALAVFTGLKKDPSGPNMPGLPLHSLKPVIRFFKLIFLSYVTTVTANILRISMVLFLSRPYIFGAGFFESKWLHLIESVAVYFSALIIFYFILHKKLKR